MKVLLSLVLLAPASFAQGHVLVVDAAGGGAYTQIAAALQNAAPGDVLLVKPAATRASPSRIRTSRSSAT
jgi:hypothetical protein